MKETWNYKLTELLKNARLGNATDLNNLLKKYAPLAVTNEDFSVLLLFRHFKVQLWEDERRVLNCHPDDENFQCGITIAKSDNDGSGMESNIYFPNNLHYKTIKIKQQQIEIITNEKTVTTNITELFRKLKFFKRSISEREIQTAFNNLCNEQYAKPKEPKVLSKTIELPSFGTMTYDEKLKWYNCQIKINGNNVDLTIFHTTPKKLDEIIAFAEKQMKAKFYEQILLDMETKMLALKNDVWLGEDKETGEDEVPITIEDFRKRIAIDSIGFDEDCCSVIYCNDDDIFFGHQIEIHIDKNGKYKDANLAG